MNRILKFFVFLFLFSITLNLMSIDVNTTYISSKFQCKSGPIAPPQPFEVENLLQVEKLGEEENQEPIMSAVSIQYQEVEKVEEPKQVVYKEPEVTAAAATVTISDSTEVDLTPYKGDIYEMAKVVMREAYSVKPLTNASRKTQWSAVVWTILNRYDKNYGKLYQIYSAEGQYAYYPDTVPTQDVIDVVTDTVKNWLLEKQGVYQGRVLPSDYLWFVGNGSNNIFRNRYSGKYTVWTWNLGDYYANY